MHHGQTIFTHCNGVRNVEDDKQSPVDVDTAYLLGSLTKAFITASCGILVDEGKLDWDKPISSYVPFHQSCDPVISSRATLLDGLSHSTGFPQIDISWYGAQGESILEPDELYHVVNHIPVFPDFRAKFHYTNWMYSVAGRMVEAVGGADAEPGWGHFVRRRIFEPLEMQRSCSNRKDLLDHNFAEPHTALDHGRPGRLPVPDFSDKTITGASAAIWSTVTDMLKWTRAILQRLRFEVEGDQGIPGFSAQTNPLRHMSRILAHQFRVTDDTINENSYALGWARHLLPSKHLGWLSINGPQPNHVIGKDSRPRLAFYHGGQITGYLNSVYMFPETDSAVIVLTNAQGAGDCSDWVAQAVIQELFDLQPRLDFDEIVQRSAKEHLTQYQRLKDEYGKHRQQGTSAPAYKDVVGTYTNQAIRMTIEVFVDGGCLQMQLNGRSTQRHKLTHYHQDVFGFLPASREEQQLRCLVDYFSYEQFLLSFGRSVEKGQIVSLSWRMQDDFGPILFTKQL